MKTTTSKFSAAIRRAICLVMTFCMVLSMLAVTASSEEASDGGNDSVDIVVLAKDVEKASIIKADMLTTKTIKSKNAPKNAITDVNAIVGKYATTGLRAGDYAYADMFAKNTTKEYPRPSASSADYIYISEYVDPKGGKDITSILQSLIKTNRQSTIYFPDGLYILSDQIETPANASSSVSLVLSDGAVIRASSSWSNAEKTMFHLGGGTVGGSGSGVGKIGSYFSFQGGTLDCNGVASGITMGGVTGVRETLVRDVFIKNSQIGIEVLTKGNNNSSDNDIDDVTIIGNGKKDSVGIYFDGIDNSATNVRIFDTHVGVLLEGGGNLMRNIYVHLSDTEKNSEITENQTTHAASAGFREAKGRNYDNTADKWGNGNWMLHCSAVNYATAFEIYGDIAVIDSCRAKWTSRMSKNIIAFAIINGELDSTISSPVIEVLATGFDSVDIIKDLKKANKYSSKGRLEAPAYDPSKITGTEHEVYLVGGVIIPLG